MIPVEEKERMWRKALKDFLSNPMIRGLHFILRNIDMKNSQRKFSGRGFKGKMNSKSV
ncbi:MAG: hypothetical protein KIH09_11715 [Candidatus Freyarchaeota archaeon]|nr:hypothetical protein [Candidatus Jordarchaeia archaeon]